MMRAPMILVCACALACGPTVSEQAREQVVQPVDCGSAEADIARLEAAKASVGARIAAGVRMVVPVAIVGGLVQRDMRNRASVAAGAYNDELDTKIFQIRQRCDLPEGELTDEGLMEVTNARVGFAAIAPGVDMASYEQLMILPVYMGFRETSRRPEPEAIEDVRRWFHEAFVSELQGKAGYRMVTDPGPRVLLVRPALANIEVTAPPEPTSGKVWVARTGEVTLIAEFRDGASGKLIGRVVDRRAIGDTGTAYRATSVGHASEVRKLFRRWAILLRQRLDEANELSAARQEQG